MQVADSDHRRVLGEKHYFMIHTGLDVWVKIE